MIHIGVKLPGGVMDTGELLADAAALEAAGADSVWVGEGMLRPAAGALLPPTFDPWMLLAAIAAVTSRIRIGTSVSVAAQWPPHLFAVQLATLDHLSRGRLLVGVGAGWERAALAASGIPPAERGSRLDELLDAVRMLWTDPGAGHRGRHYRVPPGAVVPPFQPGGPPVLVGGFSEPAYHRAARHRGFIHGGGSPAEVAPVLAHVRELWQLETGGEGEFDLWVQVRAPDGRASWPQLLAGYERAGATGVIVDFDPRLVDLLRNPDQEIDRQDMNLAMG